jgi:hypothetical protein
VATARFDALESATAAVPALGWPAAAVPAAETTTEAKASGIHAEAHGHFLRGEFGSRRHELEGDPVVAPAARGEVRRRTVPLVSPHRMQWYSVLVSIND